MDAMREAEAKTGKTTHYYPMLAGPFDRVEAMAAFAKQQGCFGVMVPPLLIGPDTGFHLARKYDLAVMAHPTFTGSHFHDPTHGMTPAAMYGTLWRLFGTDISIFPNYGGRFTFTVQECMDLRDALAAPMGGLKSAFPAPAGGMTIEKVGDMVKAFGTDTALLIGGALMRYSSDPEVSARAFVTAVEKAAKP
jgi:ribulose-bisphosphate carboxylase large chain